MRTSRAPAPALALLTLLAAAAAHPALAAPRLPQQPPALAPQTFIPLPVGSITPRGWLLEQLKLQAEGLSGHLAMFYPSIGNSWWVGGTDDQGGWIYQQAPYWCVELPPSYVARRAATH